MLVEFKLLKTTEEFQECEYLQKKIFKLPNRDIISKRLLYILADPEVPAGMVIGMYKKEKDTLQMIGLFSGMGMLLNNSIYALAMGLLPEHQNGIYGTLLLKEIHRQCCLKKIAYLYGKYTIFHSTLGKLYHELLGVSGFEYIQSNHSFMEDKLFFRWDMKDTLFEENLKRNKNKQSISELLSSYPFINLNNYKQVFKNRVLLELPLISTDQYDIPEDGFEKTGRAIRFLLNEFINNRHFILTRYFAHKTNQTVKTYVFLEKTNEPFK